MICSHRHKFIFIKTVKTASTSVEMGLERFCGPEDIVTPIWADGRDVPEGTIQRAGRNYKKSLAQHTLRDFASLLYRRSRQIKFSNHASASDIKAVLDPQVWNTYFKFSVMRNPFDWVISQYFWDIRNLEEKNRPTIFDWLCERSDIANQNWELCSINGELILDDFVRYENLEADLNRIGERLGLTADLFAAVNAKPMKTTQRPTGAARDGVLDPRSRQLISLLCHKEIEVFGYQ